MSFRIAKGDLPWPLRIFPDRPIPPPEDLELTMSKGEVVLRGMTVGSVIFGSVAGLNTHAAKRDIDLDIA